MDASKPPNSGVNIDRETRHNHPETETSRFFEHSKTPATSEDSRSSNRLRQGVLSFKNNAGELITKQPLTNPQDSSDPRRTHLRDIAKETKVLLPGLLVTRPDAKPEGYLYDACDGLDLDRSFCPRLPSIKVRVVNSDTIDAALALHASREHPVCILNMANAHSAGGGWLHGALAQEEALCYRTSLSFTLKLKHYPLSDSQGIYSPKLLVIRESMKDGHGLLDFRDPSNLKVISCVSVAAVCLPAITTDGKGRQSYISAADKRLMEHKIRLILRMAIRNKHRQLILGAFGCGAFVNPRQEVADMFAKILTEKEFRGGWWEDVVFAVLQGRDGNYQTFHEILDGLSL